MSSRPELLPKMDGTDDHNPLLSSHTHTHTLSLSLSLPPCSALSERSPLPLPLSVPATV
ncbi:hypothetical protein Mapa_000159 [Marchantia paleacea]|nr:hypothetical protein Mapa_000159 [Marchantia paleacea]